MKKKFVAYCMKSFKKKREVSPKDERIVTYALEGLFSLITKLLVVSIINILIGTIKEMLMFLLFYTLIRSFSFGIHASSNLKCWVSTTLIYTGIPLLIKYLYIPFEINLIISIICSIIIIIYAPADTPKRPILRKEQRKRNKILTSIILLFILLTDIFLNTNIINNSIVYTLLIQFICINPLTYRICHTQFNNYKYYKNVLN